jgi:hypothetical protein
MQHTPSVGEIHEKRLAQMAAVQQTNLPRIPPKPSINFGHQQQQHLLSHSSQFVFAKAQNVNLNNCAGTTGTFQRQVPARFATIHHHSNQTFHRPKQQLVQKQMPPRMSGAKADYVENRAEKSDPENHIYEMIDESEVSGDIFQVPTHHPSTGDATKENSNLFQNLLRAEMMNQIQSCNRIGSNGYLSHLTQEKRMDIIQETALGLATAAYLEK